MAHTNRMFRAGFASSRAVVPIAGYYEWVAMDDGKQPYYVHPTGGELLHAVGLTAAEQNSDGDWDMSFTIITCEGKDAAGDVHDRMPAFLDDELIAEWLAPVKLEKDEREHLHGTLGDVSEKIASSMVTRPVDRAVNNVRTLDCSDSGLIAPSLLS